jgi:hypothetical protein
MKRIFAKIKLALINRGYIANFLMISFILLTAIGAGLIFPPAGLIVAGLACGIVGFLLGLE